MRAAIASTHAHSVDDQSACCVIAVVQHEDDSTDPESRRNEGRGSEDDILQAPR